jgi:hypothetical protein
MVLRGGRLYLELVSENHYVLFSCRVLDMFLLQSVRPVL